MINTILLLGLLILVYKIYTILNDIKYQNKLILNTVDGIKCHEMRLIKEKLGIDIKDWEKKENDSWEQEHLELINE